MRRQKQTPEHIKGVDRDHLLFYRQEWTASPNARRLRNTQWLIPWLDREIHEAKHDAVAFVPPLGRFTLALVVRDFDPVVGDHIASLEELIKVVDNTRHDSKLPSDERRYTSFTVDALERSLPFVRAGIVNVTAGGR